MENSGVVCDVCGCCHNESGCKCNLDQIKVTEHTNSYEQGVNNPHFCESYEQR